MKPNTPPLSYKDAGVDVDAGNALIERIKPLAKSTAREGVVDSLGGFGALFELPLHRYQHPLMVSGTDGVGTKLRLALEAEKHDTVGIDLVAMCANDILAQGAEPLFFLDYYATGKLDLDVAEAVISGIAEGCRQANMALIGGETAEMPGMYSDGDYDLAGFALGIVERDKVIDGSKVAAGDKLLGLPSSGPHSNGFSLIRKVLEQSTLGLKDELDGRSLESHLLEPTTIYVQAVRPLLDADLVHGIAHITGGGLTENIARILPDTCGATVYRGRWTAPPVFDWLQTTGNISNAEMQRTFNCGIGLVIACPADAAEQAIEQLADQGIDAIDIGEIAPRSESDLAVQIR